MLSTWIRIPAAFVAVLATALFAIVAEAAPVKLRLLHLNDVYEISPRDGQGGIAEVLTLIKQERAGGQATLVTFGGDLLSPSVLSGLTKGAQMVEMLNAIGTNVAVLGNHEFDFGGAILAERVKASKFPWLATNVTDSAGKIVGGAADVWTTQVGEYKVGFFGLLTPETETLSNTGRDVVFKPIVETATAAVKALKDQGAQVIIAVTHLDLSQDRQLAAKVAGINVILGGHDHDPMQILENNVLIFKTGSDAKFLGVADLSIDTLTQGQNKVVTVVPTEWRLRSTRGVPADAELAPKVAAYNKQLDDALNVPVGPTEVALDSQRSAVRGQETNMGDLIADAMRAFVGADVGFTQGGGIRGDKVYPAGTVLTRKDILTELPFGNVVVVTEISGAELRAAVENGVSQVADKAGRFPQISGMSFVYDPAKPAGARVLEIKVGGAPLDNAKSYKIATNDFMLEGGDGYAALGKGKVLVNKSGGTLMATVVMDYVAKLGKVTSKVEGRIKTP